MHNLNEPLISVIVPIFKVEKYLKKCIESIINQTYSNLQIILIDDGSPDKCGKICEKYAAKDNRIQVVHKENGGLSDARNVGISIAKGEYIGFVDSDDYLENNMYEYLFNLLNLHNADVSICNFYNVIEGKQKVNNIDDGIKIYNKVDILKEILLDETIQSYAWNKLYKKSLFNNIKYPVGKTYEDIGTTFYILENCNKVAVTGKPLYNYVKRKNSIVNVISEKTIIDYIELVIERYKYINENYSELENYNNKYLLKILKTAYTDISKLVTISSDLQEKYNELRELTKPIEEEYKKNNFDKELLDEEQAVEIDMYLYNQA